MSDSDAATFELTPEQLPWLLVINSFYPTAPAQLRMNFVAVMALFWAWAEGENESEELAPEIAADPLLARLWVPKFLELRDAVREAYRRIDPQPFMTLDDLMCEVPRYTARGNLMLGPVYHSPPPLEG